MSDKWVTFAEAAAALKVHPRTVERQIKGGKLQSRRTAAGQLEVMIDVVETLDANSEALSVVAGQAENQVQFALGATSAIVKSAQEDAQLARMDAERAWDETRIARRGSRLAWSLVGTMAVALVLAVGWTASSMTRAQVELKHASEQVKTLSDNVGQVASERDHLREQMADSNEKRARAEGELSGRVSADNQAASVMLQERQKPTTRPSLLEPRLANLLWGTSSDMPGGQ
jgi:outer membrane murein-binding lipoprotein Lpp